MSFLLLACAVSVASALLQSHPFWKLLGRKQSPARDALDVDLGYGIYRGFTNATTEINTWRGIRYAAPPTGALRWQSPRLPAVHRSSVMQANAYGPQCNQVSFSGMPGLESRMGAGDFEMSEDCLFLNVQSPVNALNLPVLVWIHGGGYGAGSGQSDFTDLLHVNGNSFVVVSIQYRLGPFGFLASEEVVRRGVANAGLLDQFFALQWVQAYIDRFGGNASMVTISGESAGGGSVMLHGMAYGGSLGDALFRSAIAASPYLPRQYVYNDRPPTQSYHAFADSAGCHIGASQPLFDCLVSKDTAVLQNASVAVTATMPYGTWAFLPVTDRVFIQGEPSSELLKKKLNGHNLLVGNNANEGPLFTPQNITTESALRTWLHDTLPEFGDRDIDRVLRYYPESNASNKSHSSQFATNGVIGPSALDQSSLATGQQQRANNIYAELIFVCPSYWMAEAYSSEDRAAYKYQFSVPPGTHASDVPGYHGPLGGVPYLSADLQQAFMTIWGSFVTRENPSIPYAAAGTSAAAQWPAFSVARPYQLNINQTGGRATVGAMDVFSPVDTIFFAGPGRMNSFSLADAYMWERGRGVRCDFWRGVAPIVPM